MHIGSQEIFQYVFFLFNYNKIKVSLFDQYNSKLNYIWFAIYRGSDRIGYHLSKARDESYYALYDINPYSKINTLRFCRKDDIKKLIKETPSCNYKHCTTSKCLNITLPSQTDDLRFGFYACIPKNSLASIVYTQSFPGYGIQF